MRRVFLLTFLGLVLGTPPASAAKFPELERLANAGGGERRDLSKLDSGLQALAADALGAPRPERGGLRVGAIPSAPGTVMVDVYSDGDLEGLADSLRQHGMRGAVISRRYPQRLVEGELPVDALTDVAKLDGVRAVLAVTGNGTNTGSVNSQGDAVHRGPQARGTGVDGSGVSVGIVSDSFDNFGNGLEDSQATGDLPGPTSSPPARYTNLDDGPPGGDDEGRAMAEIIYDSAPGVREWAFHTGTLGAANRAQGIDELVAAGVDVIADDTFQLTEPFFQDGVVAKAVDRAKAAGVTYVVSAGNRARQSWQGAYAAAPDTRGVSADTNDFATGAAVDTVQTLGTFGTGTVLVSLQWDDPWGAATTDLALDIYKINGTTATYSQTVNTNNLTTKIPSEYAQISLSGTTTIGLAIRRVAGTRAPYVKYIVGGTPTFIIAEHNVATAGAIDPDASSALGALTVGAVDSADSGNNTPQAYSSRGPAVRRLDGNGNRLSSPQVRNKPDLAGADGVSTTVPLYKRFYGTSAAAPSVAAVAVLVRSANSSLTVDEVATILKDPRNTIDCTSTAGVPDPDCGYGLPLADRAVAQARDTSPPTIAETITPASPIGPGGYYPGNVAVRWTVSDAGSPLFSTSGCGTSTVSKDGSTSLTCVARSVGGTARKTITLKRDGTAPSAPVISGIEARSYKASEVPPASGIKCSATDTTSGATCTVSGRSTTVGPHTLAATARNGAGLTSTSSLTYTVTADPSPTPTPTATPTATPVGTVTTEPSATPSVPGITFGLLETAAAPVLGLEPAVPKQPATAPAVTKVSRSGRSVRYTVSSAVVVRITVARRVRGKWTSVKRLRRAAKAGGNTATLPRMRPGTYRVTVRPAGGKARTFTFKTPRP